MDSFPSAARLAETKQNEITRKLLDLFNRSDYIRDESILEITQIIAICFKYTETVLKKELLKHSPREVRICGS